MTTGQRPPVVHRVATVVAGAGVAAAVAVCLFSALGTHTLGVDEPVYVQAGWEYVHGDASRNLEHPYLAKQVIGLSQLAFGRTVVGARVAGVLLAAATTLLVFEVARRIGGRWVGLGAAALYGVLPQAPGTNVLRVDRIAVLEPTMTFAVVLSLLLAVVALQRGRRSLLAAAAFAAGLATSAKFPGAVSVVPVAVVALALPGPLWRRLATLAGAGAVTWLGFWAPYVAQGDWRLRGVQFALDFQRQHAADGHAQIVAGTLHLDAPWWSHWWWQQTYLGPVLTTALWLCAGFAVLWCAVLWRAAGSSSLRPARGPLGLVVALLAASVGFVLLSPLRLPHYHLLWAPALLVAAAVGVQLALRRWRTAPLAALLLVPAVVVAGATVTRAASLQPADYARLPAVLDETGARPGPVLVFGYPQLAEHYLPAGFPPAFEAGAVAAVVVDPVVADRRRGTDLDRLVQRTLADCGPARRVDRLLVHVCPAGAARGG